MRSLRLLVLCLALGASACATRPDPSDPDAVAEFEQNNDPLEPTNRALFSVHQTIDRAVLRPAAVAYRAVVPPPVRTGIRNVLGNLRAPVIFLNDALQGNPERARDTLARFMLNSTVGLGGIFDVAAAMGLPGHTEDFGQTLAAAGLGEGPYLFIPLLGPSNPRDLVGTGVDIVSNPFTYLTFGSDGLNNAYDYGVPVARGLDLREGVIETLDAVNSTSLDPYATIRSGYRQQRNREIRNAERVPTPGASPASSSTGLGVGSPDSGSAAGAGTGGGTAPAPAR
ncbi:VacJ family lipoprotein [Roseomonas sp. BN140053]|uniref:MlaA family lipoprotein n=1 Tax=Roseomonas sp. BN140053 TaxID=3391898 RepID=UPI0039E8B9C4